MNSDTPKLTRQEFIYQWTTGDRAMYVRAAERGRFAIPCGCGENGCTGWAMGRPEDVEKFLATIPAALSDPEEQ